MVIVNANIINQVHISKETTILTLTLVIGTYIAEIHGSKLILYLQIWEVIFSLMGSYLWDPRYNSMLIIEKQHSFHNTLGTRKKKMSSWKMIYSLKSSIGIYFKPFTISYKVLVENASSKKVYHGGNTFTSIYCNTIPWSNHSQKVIYHHLLY